MGSGKPGLFVVENSSSPDAEAYRFLRLAVQSAWSAPPPRTLLLASAGDVGVAKAALVANLAAAFAVDGRQVLLVDADLRDPSLDGIFGLDNARGLTTYLSDLEDSTPPAVSSGVERLRVLTSGPRAPRPAELLGSPRMATAIERLAEGADLVLFDVAPVLAAADATVLARQVEACVLVIWDGRTRREDGRRAKQLLERSGAKVVGVALGR